MQDWEAEQKAKRERAHLRAAAGKDPEASSGSESGGSDDSGDLPFACFACRKCAPLLIAAAAFLTHDVCFAGGVWHCGHRRPRCQNLTVREYCHQTSASWHCCPFRAPVRRLLHVLTPSVIRNNSSTDSTELRCREWPEAGGPPVRTQCGHCLCERCALVRQAKSGRCPVCEQPLRGVFNAASDIIAKYKLNSRSGNDNSDKTAGAAALPSAAAAIAAAACAAAGSTGADGASTQQDTSGASGGGGWDVEEAPLPARGRTAEGSNDVGGWS